MIDLYLKATSQTALRAALVAAGLATSDAKGFAARPGVSVDEIGAVYKATGVTLPDGSPEMKAGLGYHANLRLDEPLPAGVTLPIIEAPDTPYRTWLDVAPIAE